MKLKLASKQVLHLYVSAVQTILLNIICWTTLWAYFLWLQFLALCPFPQHWSHNQKLCRLGPILCLVNLPVEFFYKWITFKYCHIHLFHFLIITIFNSIFPFRRNWFCLFLHSCSSFLDKSSSKSTTFISGFFSWYCYLKLFSKILFRFSFQLIDFIFCFTFNDNTSIFHILYFSYSYFHGMEETRKVTRFMKFQ